MPTTSPNPITTAKDSFCSQWCLFRARTQAHQFETIDEKVGCGRGRQNGKKLGKLCDNALLMVVGNSKKPKVSGVSSDRDFPGVLHSLYIAYYFFTFSPYSFYKKDLSPVICTKYKAKFNNLRSVGFFSSSGISPKNPSSGRQFTPSHRTNLQCNASQNHPKQLNAQHRHKKVSDTSLNLSCKKCLQFSPPLFTHFWRKTDFFKSP